VDKSEKLLIKSGENGTCTRSWITSPIT